MSVNLLRKRRVEVNLIGPITGQYLLQHDVTSGIESHMKIHIHEVELNVNGASTITLKLGSKTVFERTLSTSGEFHTVDDNMYTSDVAAGLIISVTNAVTVRGFINYSLDL